MQAINPVADEWTEQYALYAPSSQRVLLSQPVVGFIEHCRSERLRPVLYTGEHAKLSPFVAMALRDAGGHWAFRSDAGEVFDAASGFRVGCFEDLWLDGSTDRPRHPRYTGEFGTVGVAVQFELFVQHRPDSRTRLGGAAVELLRALDASPLHWWGTAEPLLDAWDADAVTEAVRRQMPTGMPVRLRTGDGDFLQISAARNRRGVLERIRGAVWYGSSAGPGPQLLIPPVAEAFESLASDASVQVATATSAQFDTDGWWNLGPRLRPEPLVALFGPRAVRDLDLDFDDLATRHDVRRLGRSRVPGALVRWSGRDPMWAQVVAFTADLGPEAMRRALGGVQGAN